MVKIKTQEGIDKAKMILDNFDHSIFTKKQLMCLKMRAGISKGGPSQIQIAKKFKTTRQDISYCLIHAEKRAYKYKKYGKKKIPRVLGADK